MGGRLKFLREVKRNFDTVGAVYPSSRTLAKAVASVIPSDETPKRVLEVGAGTGAVTRALLPRLRKEDLMVIYELNEVFVGYLRQRFEGDGQWAKYGRRVEIRCLPFPERVEENSYDYIVSGLPINNFEPALVEEVFEGYRRACKKGGRFIFFEYCFIRKLKRPFVGADGAARLKGVAEVVDRYTRDLEENRKTVFGNIPPAWVHTLRCD